MRPMRLVHVSADYPDPVNEHKTPVIRELVHLAEGQFEQRVYSLNRRSPSIVALLTSLTRNAGIALTQQAFAQGKAVQYSAPPLGILHATMLRRLGTWLAEDLRGSSQPDMLVGHKLTIEGIAVHRAAQLLNVPYALCLQGNTDGKILDARPDLRRLLGRVYHGAAAVFAFTPWVQKLVEKRLGVRSGPTLLLPCPTELEQPIAPQNGGNGLISVFHLRGHQTKNLKGMVAAKRLMEQRGEVLPLTIVGGGSDEDKQQCRSVVGQKADVTFAGPVARDDMQRVMNQATALLLPSRRESFGLAFVEALFAGLPIIYPSGAGVDGYFDNAAFALRVDASNPQDIARAMKHAVDHEAQMKAALRTWQQGTDAQFFMRDAIARRFTSGLLETLEC